MNRLLLNSCLLLAICATANFFAFGQQPTLTSESQTKIVKKTQVKISGSETIGQPNEKAIETVARPNISLCAEAETVVVRSWQRNEVRALVSGGSAVSFKIMARGDDGKPAWVMIQNGNAPKTNQSPDECLHAETIEIEAPANAAVTIKSKEGGDILIDSLAKATVKNVSGDISLRNVREEITVTSLSGNVAVEDAAGKISITTFGDIAVFRCTPNDFGDALNLNSAGGNIVLRDARHKNIEAKSASGAIAVLGSLEPGGSYDFTALSGSVMLQLPVDFPFSIRATMTAGGNFQTDFPIKPTYQHSGGQTRQMQVTNGNGGDTIINLITVNGSLRLKKK